MNFAKFLKMVHSDYKEIVVSETRRLLDTQENPYVAEYKIVTRAGETKILCEEASIEFDSDNNPKRIIGILKDVTQQRKNKAELIEAKEKAEENAMRLEVALNSSNEGFFDNDFISNTHYYSPIWKSMLGYEDAELENKFSTFNDLLHPKDKVKVDEIIKKALSEQSKEFKYEFQMRHKTGKWIDIKSTARIFYNAKKEVIRVIGKHVDITEQKKHKRELIAAKEKAEESEFIIKTQNEELQAINEELLSSNEELRDSKDKTAKSEEKLKVLIDNIPGLVYRGFSDLSLEIISGSIEICGYSAEEIMAKETNWLNIIHPEDRDKIFAIVSELANEPKKTIQFYRIIDKNNNIRFVEDHKTSVFSKRGRFLRIDGIVFDITDRKKAEKKLKESEEKFSKLSNLTFEGILIHNQGKALEINQSFAKILGYTYKELIGENIIKKIVRKKYLPLIQQNIKLNYAKPYEIEAIKKDSSLMPVEIESRNLIYDNEAIRVTAIRDITDRKKAEKALKDSEKALKEAQEIAKIGSWSYDFNKPADIVWNEILCNLHGINFKDFDQKTETTLAFLHPDDIERVLNTFRTLINKKQAVEYENRIITKDGMLKYVHCITTITLDDNGKFIKLTGTIQDITDRKKAEQALKESENRLKAFSDVTNEAIFFSEKGVCIEANLQASELFGYSHNELLGIFGTDVIAPQSKELVTQKLLSNYEKLLSNYEKPYDAIAQKKDGTMFSAELHGKMYYYKGKKVRITAIRDITDRKKAEQALKESEAKTRQILNTFEDPIYINDTNCKIIYVNKAMEKLIGKDKIGTKCHQSIYNLQERCKWCVYDNLLKSRKLLAYDIQVPNTEQYRYVRNIIFDNNSKLTIYTDITERKKTEQKLVELNATKDKFFSIISHDLKSSFSSVLGFSEMLNKKFEKYDTVKQKTYLSYIYTGIKNTYKLLENLLLWSRTQRGNVDFNPQNVDLFSATNETIEVLRPQAKSKLIKLKNQISENIFLKADIDMLSTVIRNLVSNAIKFTHKKGSITINAQKKQHFIEIAIKDTGVGIPPKVLPKLFDISKNTTTEGTENETGTGLGLILCKEFVEKHGGKIWVESEIEKGSSFIFTIPYGNENANK